MRVNQETGKEKIYQCKGKGNKAPVERYRQYVKEFVRAKEFDIARDHANIGLIKQYDKETNKEQYYDIYHLPKGFVVEGDLDFSGQGLTELPDLSEVIVKGDFDCSQNQLISLAGAPRTVGGYFDCSQNQLTRLVGAPQTVGRDFFCSYNQLTSLVGAPITVRENFFCSYNQLTSLAGAPRTVEGDFSCTYNHLISLAGAPQTVKGSFGCDEDIAGKYGITDITNDYNDVIEAIRWKNNLFQIADLKEIIGQKKEQQTVAKEYETKKQQRVHENKGYFLVNNKNPLQK